MSEEADSKPNKKQATSNKVELELLRAELSRTQQCLLQREKELRALQTLIGFSGTISTGQRRLSRFPWPFRVAFQSLSSLFHVQIPYEFIFRKGLIIASSTPDQVLQLIEHLTDRYPWVQFHILADDRCENSIRKATPELEVKGFHRAISRKEKKALHASLLKDDYDLCAVLFAGDKNWDFLKAMGLLSGARYIKAYTELGSAFYVMIGQLGTNLRHIAWRITQKSLHRGWLTDGVTNLFALSLGKWIGLSIAFYRILPLLISARKVKFEKNPFHPQMGSTGNHSVS